MQDAMCEVEGARIWWANDALQHN